MTEEIISIEEGKKRVELRFSGGETLRFSRALWREAPLMQVGQEADPAELKKWMLLHQYQPALHYAVDLLAKQPRASGEIRRKLLERDYLDDTVDMVIYKLEKEKLLDDLGFAEQFAASRSRSMMGERRIREALTHKGVSPDTVSEAIEALDPDEARESAASCAMKLMKRYEKEADPRKRGAKLFAAMARRGYGYDEIRTALEDAGTCLADE